MTVRYVGNGPNESLNLCDEGYEINVSNKNDGSCEVKKCNYLCKELFSLYRLPLQLNLLKDLVAHVL